MLVFAIVDVAEVKWWTSKVAFGVWTGCLVSEVQLCFVSETELLVEKMFCNKL